MFHGRWDSVGVVGNGVEGGVGEKLVGKVGEGAKGDGAQGIDDGVRGRWFWHPWECVGLGDGVVADAVGDKSEVPKMDTFPHPVPHELIGSPLAPFWFHLNSLGYPFRSTLDFLNVEIISAPIIKQKQERRISDADLHQNGTLPLQSHLFLLPSPKRNLAAGNSDILKIKHIYIFTKKNTHIYIYMYLYMFIYSM